MSVPKFIVIDTSVIEASGFNFESEKLRAFVEAAKSKRITILLPDPIKREIHRHISDNARSVIGALEEAKRKAPFLKKWKEWPVKKSIFILTQELQKMAFKEWEDFLSHFTVVNLDYKDINLPEVMGWYDKQIAPFGPGKSKEFPDAIALAQVLHYANSNKVDVALLTKDRDLSKASARYCNVLAFDSFESFTQELIEGDSRLKSIELVLAGDIQILEKGIEVGFESMWFYSGVDINDGGEVSDVIAESVNIVKKKIISIGDRQCTLAFEAGVDYSAHVECVVEEGGEYDGHEFEGEVEKVGHVTDFAMVSGVAKLRFDETWKTVVDVELINFDQDDIRVNTEPDEYAHNQDEDYY